MDLKLFYDSQLYHSVINTFTLQCNQMLPFCGTNALITAVEYLITGCRRMEMLFWDPNSLLALFFVLFFKDVIVQLRKQHSVQ